MKCDYNGLVEKLDFLKEKQQLVFASLNKLIELQKYYPSFISRKWFYQIKKINSIENQIFNLQTRLDSWVGSRKIKQ